MFSSFRNLNLNVKPSLIKPIAAVVAVILVISIVFFISSKSDSDSSASFDRNLKINNAGDVEKVIAHWVEENPEQILTSLRNMQKKAARDVAKNAEKNIGANKDKLLNDKTDPEYSQGKYDVTIVEFFDYSCGYCKKASATIKELLSQDKKIRVVYKEFPILGAASMEMAQVALVVNKIDPKLYYKFHSELMNQRERGKDAAYKVASRIGIGKSRLDKAMAKYKDEISNKIQENLRLGSSVGVNGTPGFIIGDSLVPGALGIEAFKQKVAEARK